MKLQQLRFLVEVAQQGLNVSQAAEALYTSQPGVSKQIKLLEDELGLIVFERAGKRLTGVTEPGRQVIDIARRILREAENLKKVGEEFTAEDAGLLTLATTHTQARYALPPIVKVFRERYPKVRLHLHQGNPMQVADWVESGEASIGIATESLDDYPALLTLPCYQWSHGVVVPVDHPLAGAGAPTLPSLARHPLITYDVAFSGGQRIRAAFERAGIEPDIVLTAIDADVIKTYVGLGLGVGIIARMAFDAQRDTGLAMLDAGHLFGSNTTRLAVRRGTLLRRFEYDFIEAFAPALTRKTILAAMAGEGDNYQL
ncbi:MAG: CysB family HTH-type transcriptional regulator [Rhodocyclaceae bacterium]|nr:CysB family HTH-type transcriptional regulator [Rhodocyclaceae bacterium]